VGDEEIFTWRDYEEHIFEKLSAWAGDQAVVEFDQTITGKFSGVSRQIDCLITGKFANVTDRDITAAVDCKYYSKNIDVKKVDEFIGFIGDVQTDLGLLITNTGFSLGAKERATGGILLQVIVADIDQLPPAYHPSWDEAYYASEYWEAGYGGQAHGASIHYSYFEEAASEHAYDPDHPPESSSEVIASGTDDELSWGNDEERAKSAALILKHRRGGSEPPVEDIKTFVLEIAYHWQDGYPWVLYAGQLSAAGL